jgi:hypothetical protein
MEGFWEAAQTLLKGGLINSSVSTGLLIIGMWWVLATVWVELSPFGKEEKLRLLLTQAAVAIPLFIFGLAWLWS